MNYYIIKPNLSDEQVVTIEDWGFEYWPNQPKTEIVKNPDGTFSVYIEKGFVPLVTQLQQLFKGNNVPESGTYIGEAEIKGKGAPLDCIYGDFINKKQGLVISNRLLELIIQFNTARYFVYDLPLIKRRKRIEGFSYVYFVQSVLDGGFDVGLIKGSYTLEICVSEEVKNVILNSGIKGCQFDLVSVDF